MENLIELTPSVITKYNDAARIAKIVFEDLKKQIVDGERNVRVLCDVGNLLILKHVESVYKNVKCKGIGFPVSISLNNCVGNYVFEEGMDEFNYIKDDSIIKIELGVQIDGYCAMFGDTFVLNIQDKDNKDHRFKYVLDFLEELVKDIPKIIKVGDTTDDLRLFIESKCTDLDIFPVENTITQQQMRYNELVDNKKMILHHQKYYDENDYETTEPNINYEFEEHDVYDINLTVVPDLEYEELSRYNLSKTTSHVYVIPHDPHIYRFNGCFHDFKLKASREFATNVKEKHFNYGFDYTYLKTNPRYRMGMKEAKDNFVIDEYPIMYTKDKLPVFHKKFTVLVQKSRTISLKY